MTFLPRIPPFEDQELAASVSALTRSAMLMRAAFIRVASGESAGVIIRDYKQTLLLADKVIDRWADFYGIEGEDDITVH